MMCACVHYKKHNRASLLFNLTVPTCANSQLVAQRTSGQQMHGLIRRRRHLSTTTTTRASARSSCCGAGLDPQTRSALRAVIMRFTYVSKRRRRRRLRSLFERRSSLCTIGRCSLRSAARPWRKDSTRAAKRRLCRRGRPRRLVALVVEAPAPFEIGRAHV